MDRKTIKALLKDHPQEKMLFLAGPRQVGKTTFSKKSLESYDNNGIYLNWDILKDRKNIRKGDDFFQPLLREGALPRIILDEIHKMSRFKGWLKGFYDQYRDDFNIWVTGSGRLDLYQKGGDSLLGRYFLYRMHPLSVGEFENPINNEQKWLPENCWKNFLDGKFSERENFNALYKFGGFPEPFLRQEESFLIRWQNTRKNRILKEDIRDLTRIQEVDRVEHLVELLNPRVASPLSLNSLKDDLEVAFETVKNWVKTLERLYYIWGISPFSTKIQRGLRKERKIYFWDWSEIIEESKKFENFVLSHFNKSVHFWNDSGAGRFSLHYIRDKEKNEADVLIAKDRIPWLIAEVKMSDTQVSGNLVKFMKQTQCKKALQIVFTPGIHKKVKIDGFEIHVVSADRVFKYFS